VNTPDESGLDAARDDISAYALDTFRVRRSFDRAASTFDAAAVLHAEVRENLLARLDLTTL
jgi:malonyl-CoA O-methyltransferase